MKQIFLIISFSVLSTVILSSKSAANDAVCEIVGGMQYETIDAAIAAVPADTPTTIRLLQTIDRTITLTINGSKKITLKLNGFNLNITVSTQTNGAALEVKQGSSLTTTGSGTLNASGFIYGIYAAEGAVVNITGNVSATGGYSASYGSATGIYAYESAGIPVTVTVNGDVSGYIGVNTLSGAEITVNGNISGIAYAGRVMFGGSLSVSGDATSTGEGACIEVTSATAHVGGNVTTSGDNSNAIYVGASSTVTVGGNVSSIYHGITAQSGNINVTGNVISTSTTTLYTVASSNSALVEIGGDITGAGDCGVLAETSGKVTVTGKIQSFYTGIRVSQSGEVVAKSDIIADGAVGTGVNAYSLGKATIDGRIRAYKNIVFGESNGTAVTPTTQTGYLTYSDGEGSYIWVKEQPTTFVLSNEEGGLIDRLIAGGYGDGSLYDALVALEPASGDIISQSFLDALLNCPAGSLIFTKKLNEYAHLNGAIAINTDGTAFTTTSIKGRDYYGAIGYSTYPPDISGAGRELFTYAGSPEYYIDAVNGSTTYKVFAIGWSSNQVPTFILSNEESGLIDKLIVAGHGDNSLYEVLQLLQPVSGGVIPTGFMSALAACSSDCDAKTAPLSNFSSEFNNPIGIGADGNLIVAQIHGRDYYNDTDFTTTTGTVAGVGTVQFTAPDSTSEYVDAGTLVLGKVMCYYKVFGVAWRSIIDAIPNINTGIFRIYPNPTSGILKIVTSESQSINRVEVYNMQGQKMGITEKLPDNTVDLSGLTPGVYLLRVQNKMGLYTLKIIKN